MKVKSIPWEELVKDATPQLFNLGREMISSWAQKPSEQSNASWLAGEMGKHIGMSADEASTFSDDVMGGIESFNEKLDAIDRSCRQGGTKEAWLAKRLEELPADDMAARGAYLEEMRNGLKVGNAAAYHAMETGEMVSEYPELPSGLGEPWSKAQVKSFAREIGQQATLAGSMGAAMDIEIPEGSEGEPVVLEGMDESNDMRGSAIDVGLKAVAVGALKIAAHKGMLPKILQATPIPALVSVACSGMENIRIAGQLARRQISPAQAVERMGRVSCAAVGELAGHFVTGKVLTMIPGMGSVAARALSMVVSDSIRNKVSEKVTTFAHAGFEKVRPMATKVVTTIVEKSQTIFASVKNFAKNLVTA